MSRLGINTGNNPNDGQGDPLRVAMGKINSNFLEVYNSFGDGFNLVSYANTAGISTLSRNLTGSPRITVSGILNTGITTTEHIEVRNITSTGVVTATQFVGDGSQLTNVTARASGLEVLDDDVRKGVARELNFGANIVSSGPDGRGRVTISVGSSIIISGIVTTADYASVAGYSTASGISTYATTAGIATLSEGLTGTPNLNVGVITATSYRGSGANLTGIITTLVAGSNVSITQSSGIATINASGGSGAVYAIIAGYSTSSGISTVAQNLTGTPNISVNQVGISSFLSVSGVTSFFNDVHFEYDRAVLIGNNDELQLYHNGTNSYIDNSSGGNLIIRSHGGSIQLQKETPELMGVFNTDGGVELYYNNSNKFETTGYGVTIFGGLNATGVVTALSFRPSGGYIQAADGTNSFYIYNSTGNVSFQGTIGASQLNSAGGNKVIGLAGTDATFENNLSVSGILTASVVNGSDFRFKSIAEKTTVISGNTVNLVYNTGGGNIAICTNPTGDITLNVTGIPTDSTFNNYSLTFSVIVSNTGTAHSCTTVTLNGVSTTVKWFGGSLAAAISGVTTTTGYDIYNFTGINTVGSASTTANYIVLGSVNGGYR